jgi:hypothetical protein
MQRNGQSSASRGGFAGFAVRLGASFGGWTDRPRLAPARRAGGLSFLDEVWVRRGCRLGGFATGRRGCGAPARCCETDRVPPAAAGLPGLLCVRARLSAAKRTGLGWRRPGGREVCPFLTRCGFGGRTSPPPAAGTPPARRHTPSPPAHPQPAGTPPARRHTPARRRRHLAAGLSGSGPRPAAAAVRHLAGRWRRP